MRQRKKPWMSERKKKTPAFLHGVFRRGENAPLRKLSRLPIFTAAASALLLGKRISSPIESDVVCDKLHFFFA